MELLTQNLPSGHLYPFPAIHVSAMNFAQILEYLENVPDEKKQPVEKYYFDYCLVKDEDPNIGSLLLVDMEYVVFLKKALTISQNLEYDSSVECPKCGTTLNYHVSLAGVRFGPLSDPAKNGFSVGFGDSRYKVRMPTVDEFMSVFSKYRVYKRVSDMRIIKLISLFEYSMTYLQRIEALVVNSTHRDIAVLITLDKIFFNFIQPIHLHCDRCAEMYVPSDSEIFETKMANGISPEEDLPDHLTAELKRKAGGIEIGLGVLVSEFFRDLFANNRPSPEEIVSREVREDA